MKKMRFAYFALGALFAVSAVVSSLLSNTHAGVLATYALAAVFISLGIFCGKIACRIPTWVPRAFFAAVGVAAAAIAALYVYGSIDNVSYKEDVVIVLGCGLRGDVPARQLRSRLDAAAEYYTRNPDVLIVVSGGQGENEDISESAAMKKYLLALGIPDSAIVEEALSTSTEENFRFSAAIVGKRFDDPDVAFITNDYHILRASLHAGAAGLGHVSHMHSGTPLYLLIPNGIRECLGITRQFIFGWI